MKRFTQYLYEYHQGKRIRNIGFVKAEQGDGFWILQIQGRGLEVKLDEALKVYLFYQRGNGYEASYQGEVPKKKPIVNYRLEFSDRDIGNAESMEDIVGVMLVDAGGRRFAAVWNGENVNVDEIDTEVSRAVVQETIPEVVEVVSQVEADVESQDVLEDEVLAQDVLEDVAAVEPVGEEVEVSEQMVQNVYEKIQRKDLARLPRKDWRLANNNFLLHGFYNYHHLLWIEEEGELYIGVPGVRHAREMQAAHAFGFGQFRYAAEIMPNTEEEDIREDFGYFCRRIIRNE